MLARLVRNINPYPLGAGVTAPSPGVRPVINRQKREGKAVSASQTWRPRQAGGYGQDIRRRCVGVVMENQPTLAYVCQKRTRAGPKMGMDPGLACLAAQDCAQMGPGVKHPPKVTQNG